MPITLAHPAAVLPLRSLPLPMSALVAGSMVPDLPLYVLHQARYEATHSWTGALLLDPVLAMLGLAVWFFWVRDVVADLVPPYVRSRLPARARLTVGQWALAPLAAAVGALTHVTWDAFTHGDRWGVELVPWLQEQHGRFVGYLWAQHLSGVVGMLVVAAALVIELRRRPVVRERGAGRLPTGVAVLLLTVPALLAGARAARDHRMWGHQAMAFNGVVEGAIGMTFGLFVVTWLWHLRRPSPPSG